MHSVELFVDVHIVKRHATVDVLCRPVVRVVIGVHIVVLFVLLVNVQFVVLTRHFRCGIYRIYKTTCGRIIARRGNNWLQH